MIPELTTSEYIRILIGSFLIGLAPTVPVYAMSKSFEEALVAFIGFFIAALLHAFGLVVPVINGATHRFLAHSNATTAKAVRERKKDLHD